MTERFDPYELLALAAPGAVLAILGATASPAFQAYLKGGEGMSLGGLGFFLLVSIVAGHLVQALANLAEAVYWGAWGGMPTVRLLSENGLLSAPQRSRLAALLEQDGILARPPISAKDWGGAVGEMRARISTSGQSARLDAFLRTYGLMRGVAVAFLIATVAAPFSDNIWIWWHVSAISATAAIISGYRAHRFAVHFARELAVRYLSASHAGKRPK